MLLNWRAVTNFFFQSPERPLTYRGFLMGQGVWDQATNLAISSSLWLLQFVLLLIFEQVQGEHFKRKCFSEGANSWVVELPGVHSQAVAPLNFSLWSTFKEQQQQKLNFVSLCSLYPFFWSEECSGLAACVKEEVTDAGSQGSKLPLGQ